MAVTVTGSASAAGTSVAIPTHAVGNVIVVMAYRNDSATPPTTPAAAGTVPAWVTILSNGANTNSMNSVFFVATATNHTTGTFTNATHVMAAVISWPGVGNPSVAALAASSTSSTQATTVTLGTLQRKFDGSSVLLHALGHRTVTAWSTAPAGFTRQTTENTGVCLNTRDDTTTGPACTQLATTSGSSGFIGPQIEICSPDPRVVGAATAAATSVAIPTHAIGDLIVVWAYRDGSTTTPDKPAAAGTVPAWVDIDNNTGGNSNSARSARFIATATNHTSGTWTNATGMGVLVIKGHDPTTPIGAHGEQTGSSSTNAIAPAVTLSRPSGYSIVVEFFGHQTVTTWGAAPAGYRAWATTNTECTIDQKHVSTSAGSVTQPATTSGSGGYYAQQVEILSASPAGTAAATARKATFDSGGTQAQIGTAAPALRKALFTGAGAQTQTGTAAAILRKATMTAAGEHTQSGTAAPQVQAAAFSGVAEQTQTGTASVTTRRSLFAAVGEQIGSSALTATLKKLAAHIAALWRPPPTPAERIDTAPTENRVTTVAADNRTETVPPDNRTTTATDNRATTVR